MDEETEFLKRRAIGELILTIYTPEAAALWLDVAERDNLTLDEQMEALDRLAHGNV